MGNALKEGDEFVAHFECDYDHRVSSATTLPSAMKSSLLWVVKLLASSLSVMSPLHRTFMNTAANLCLILRGGDEKETPRFSGASGPFPLRAQSNDADELHPLEQPLHHLSQCR